MINAAVIKGNTSRSWGHMVKRLESCLIARAYDGYRDTIHPASGHNQQLKAFLESHGYEVTELQDGSLRISW